MSALFLTESEAAEILHVSPRTLARWRAEGTPSGPGPRYRRHGTEALYTIDDLRAWSDARAFTSTAEEKSRKEVA